MATPKRSTIYFDPDLHRALRLKAAATDRSISDVVNDAVLQTVSEDAADLEVFEKRHREPALDERLAQTNSRTRRQRYFDTGRVKQSTSSFASTTANTPARCSSARSMRF